MEMNELDEYILTERPELIEAIHKVMETSFGISPHVGTVTKMIAELIRIDDSNRRETFSVSCDDIASIQEGLSESEPYEILYEDLDFEVALDHKAGRHPIACIAMHDDVSEYRRVPYHVPDDLEEIGRAFFAAAKRMKEWKETQIH